MCCLHDLGGLVQWDQFCHSEVFECSDIFSGKAKLFQVQLCCSGYLVGTSGCSKPFCLSRDSKANSSKVNRHNFIIQEVAQGAS